MNSEAQEFYEALWVLWEQMPCAEDKTAAAAKEFLSALAGRRKEQGLSLVFQGGVQALHDEFSAAPKPVKKAFQELKTLLCAAKPSPEAAAEALWRAFFPEALHLSPVPEEQIELLRASRRVEIEAPATHPIANAAREMIFTSNVLLTLPAKGSTPNAPELAAIVQNAAEVKAEEQQYWYDHPVPIGIPAEQDEAVYGLRGLSRALAFERERGSIGQTDRLRVCLSVSLTHQGLRRWAKPWLKAQLSRIGDFSGLDVYAFTEEDTQNLTDLLTPWLSDSSDMEALKLAFGVDGEYGRHYSFLKALPALWSVLEDSQIRATFKIDLDQIFPQDHLVRETGKSAFEHFCSPLWGARGSDTHKQPLELGMIAGALVNEKDIAKGIFTPDIPWPEALPQADDLLFFKQRPMAVSTRAELNARYGANELCDGKTTALQRIHVTGGTNGILLEHLRRYRPFTPSFIGRAEDQGYLLSVLGGTQNEAQLRYVHASGLIMRHDKEAFASAAVKAGKTGSYIGDLIRILVFSAYAEILPPGTHGIKELTDPFTGCFISPLPRTLTLLRLALHLLANTPAEGRLAAMKLAEKRLPPWINNYSEKKSWIRQTFALERRGWNAFYSALDSIESAGNSSTSEKKRAEETARKFRSILANCKISG
ncbi:MAG: hypothetical protein B0D92_04935 [Spirochaeta sp. LUC14_002_19_P3]|nr:MAG: hypothetical protein B0D92_04935 [Spirochaeta sp. LUC14_002_19_P3]